MRRTFLLGAAVVALAAGEAHAEGLKLGALIPLTGGLQAYGEGSRNGIELAVEQMNEAGGVLDGEVTLSVGDTQTKSQPAIDAAQKLVSVEGVDAIIGALSSGNTIPVATSVTSREEVPQISNASTAPTITTLDDNGYLFRTVPSDANQGVVLANLVEEKDISKVAVIYVNNDYGQGLYEAFKENFGGEITGASAFEPNKASYRGELQELSGGNPDALLMIAYPDDGGLLILRQSIEEGFFDTFIHTDGMKTPQLAENLGEYADGQWGTSPKAAESEASQAFVSAYEEKFGGIEPIPYVDSAYDAAMLLGLAAEKAGSTEGPELKEALMAVATPPGETVGPGDFEKAKQLLSEGQEINYDGASGPVDFDEQGDVSGTYEHWKVEDGKLVTVELIQK